MSEPRVPEAAGTQAPARRGFSRRGLLTGVAGAAGLVVGAGAAEAGNLLAGGGGAPAERPPSPGEELMTEHGLLIRVIVAYRTAADRLAGTGEVPVDAIVTAAGIASDYVHSFHEGLEEAYVFPHVRAQESSLIRTLLVQHDRGRHLTAAIAAAHDLDLTRADARNGLRAQLTAFARMYEPHEAREDTVVYPALRNALPQRELDLLAERFAELENTTFGAPALALFLDRLAGVEQQLGIHDIAVFTPDIAT